MNSEPVGQNCANCRFLLRDVRMDAVPYGECRRWPPLPIPAYAMLFRAETDARKASPPVVLLSYWCGEWRGRE